MSFPLVSLADKNPDKLSHLRYNIEVVEIEIQRSNQFFIQKLRILLQRVFSRTMFRSPVFLREGWGGGGALRGFKQSSQ